MEQSFLFVTRFQRISIIFISFHYFIFQLTVMRFSCLLNFHAFNSLLYQILFKHFRYYDLGIRNSVHTNNNVSKHVVLQIILLVNSYLNISSERYICREGSWLKRLFIFLIIRMLKLIMSKNVVKYVYFVSAIYFNWLIRPVGELGGRACEHFVFIRVGTLRNLLLPGGHSRWKCLFWPILG